jgi:hypothetical protein
MRILFVGDIFGRPGRQALRDWLPRFRSERDVDFVIANAENSAGGKGLTAEIAAELFDMGVDVLTGGNHSFAQRQDLDIFDADERILRPANLPEGTPGRGLGIYSAGEARVAVLNLMGRAFMKPIDCPFQAAKRLASEALAATPILFVDMHAEATSEKVALAVYLDGRATAVIGTHTHVPSADARVTEKGTAAITDVGMTGPFGGVIGVRAEIVLEQLIVGMPVRHEVAKDDVRVCAILIDLDAATGRARSATPLCIPDFIRERNAPPMPELKVQVHLWRRDEAGRTLFAILQRTPAKGELWQPITGKVDPGESPEIAALREAREETGVEARPDDLSPCLWVHPWSRDGREFAEHVFALRCDSADLALSGEHQAHAWLDLDNALARLEFEGNRQGLLKARDWIAARKSSP